MIIPITSITLGQQGGIGYPPCIVRVKGRWYAISDSRGIQPPEDIDFEWQKCYPVRTKYFHTQEWTFKKWYSEKTPKITWDELRNMIANKKQEIQKIKKGLTIKEAKNTRCKHPFCKIQHFTCRRCQYHGHYKYQYVEWNYLLCENCGQAYEKWFKKKYIIPMHEEWNEMTDAERRLSTSQGVNPYYGLKARVAEFIKKCPIINAEYEIKENGNE